MKLVADMTRKELAREVTAILDIVCSVDTGRPMQARARMQAVLNEAAKCVQHPNRNPPDEPDGFTLKRSAPFIQGYLAGYRSAIRLVHKEAKTMSDQHATQVLNGMAHTLGVYHPRKPSHSNKEGE